MYSIINGDDTQKMSMGHQPSLSGEEANDAGENNFGGEGPLKKGPWTAAEDAILVEYVKKHGEGNWNAVQKHSGLARCGKSCRLRWANHLRPDLKKGAFTREEERKIIELHAKWGNKWARMAAELPGRTDNEIKNYWNTRIKRMERAGLPLYPPDICIQESSNASGLMNGASQQSDLLQPENFEIPDLDFKNFKHNQGYVSYVPAIFDIPERNTFELSAGSSNSYNKIMFPTIPPSEQFCESGMPYNTVESGIGRSVPVLSGEYLGYAFEEDAEPLEYADYPNEIAELPQYVGYACEEIAEPSKLSSSCGPNHNTSDQFQVDNFPGSHAVINGNTSSSVPISVAMKELPSLQYVETQQCCWGALVSPLHSLDSVDKFIESPPVVETLSGPTPEQISGLLEAVVYESKNIENSLQQTPDNFLHRSSTLKPIEAELNEQEDPHCTVGQSAESVHHEFTPASRYSLDDPKSVGTSKDHDIKHEIVTRDPTYYFKTKQNLNEIDLTRPDVLLDCGWFQNDSKYSNDRYLLQDAIDALRGEEIHDDH